MASLITSLTIVYSTVYSDADQRKQQSSASLAFLWGIHRGPVNSPHKWAVTWKMFPFDYVIMLKHDRRFGDSVGEAAVKCQSDTSFQYTIAWLWDLATKRLPDHNELRCLPWQPLNQWMSVWVKIESLTLVVWKYPNVT